MFTAANPHVAEAAPAAPGEGGGSVRVLAFAGARDVLGAAEVELPVGDRCTAAELLDRVCERYPGLAPHKRSLRVAVNGAYAFAGDRVAAGDEVALIPPVAGG